MGGKEKWFQVTRQSVHFPTGMHGRNMASETSEREPFAPRRRFWPTADQCAGARPLYFRSSRSSLLDKAFHSPAATANLSIRNRGRVNAPDLHLRSDSKTYAWP